YELIYLIEGNEIFIKCREGQYQLTVNGVPDNLKIEYLPSQVITSYSGEESRLWDNYYWPFYEEYIKAIRGATLPNSKLVYINKYYWNIALLTLHFYDFADFTDIANFCQDTLNISNI